MEAGLAVHRPTRRGRRARPYLSTPPASDRRVAEQTPLVSKGLLESNVKYKIRKRTTTGSIHIKLKVLPTNFGLLNCQSTKQKTTILNDWIVDNKLDIAVLTETWLTGTEFDKTIISEICPLGYRCVHVPRKDRRGGGIAIILKKGYKTNIKPSNTYNTFEHMIVLTEFDLLLEVVYLENNIVIVGDFNYDWVGQKHHSTKQKLPSILENLDLTQQVCEPTHVSGSTLNYVISRNDEKTVIASSVVTVEYVSNHCAVLCKLQIEKPKEHWSEVKYRRINKIKNDVFSKDLTSIVNNLSTAGHEDRVKLYFSSLRSILDQHAPVQKRLLLIIPHRPWYTEKITQAKKEK